MDVDVDVNMDVDVDVDGRHETEVTVHECWKFNVGVDTLGSMTYKSGVVHAAIAQLLHIYINIYIYR